MRCGGRALLSAWIPAGPIDAMLAAMGRILGRVTQAPPPERFLWSDPAAVDPLARRAGLALQTTSSAELAIRDSSPEAYVVAGQHHPMALSVRPVLERAGVGAEVQEAMTAVLREANEDPEGFPCTVPTLCTSFVLLTSRAATQTTRPTQTSRRFAA